MASSARCPLSMERPDEVANVWAYEQTVVRWLAKGHVAQHTSRLPLV